MKNLEKILQLGQSTGYRGYYNLTVTYFTSNLVSKLGILKAILKLSYLCSDANYRYLTVRLWLRRAIFPIIIGPENMYFVYLTPMA